MRALTVEPLEERSTVLTENSVFGHKIDRIQAVGLKLKLFINTFLLDS